MSSLKITVKNSAMTCCIAWAVGHHESIRYVLRLPPLFVFLCGFTNFKNTGLHTLMSVFIKTSIPCLFTKYCISSSETNPNEWVNSSNYIIKVFHPALFSKVSVLYSWKGHVSENSFLLQPCLRKWQQTVQWMTFCKSCQCSPQLWRSICKSELYIGSLLRKLLRISGKNKTKK